MKPNRLIALTATAGIVAAGIAGCSSHKAATGTTPGASTSPRLTVVPQGVWQIQDLTALSGAPVAVLGGIAGYVSQPDGTQHVIANNAEGPLDEVWWDRSGWHLKDLTAATSAPLSGGNGPVGYAYAGTQHVVYVGRNDNHIYELWWRPRAPG